MRLVLGITGASGSLYARRCLGALRAHSNTVDGANLRVDVVASPTAATVWQQELGVSLTDELSHLAADMPGMCLWEKSNFSAPFASGSNAADVVLVLPCSMTTLARIAHGGGSDLLHRACDVALKERKRLVLVVRETPLSRVHLVNLLAAHDAGACILPAIPSFYGDITTLNDAVDTVVCRALDHAGLRLGLTKRWGQHDSD